MKGRSAAFRLRISALASTRVSNNMCDSSRLQFNGEVCGFPQINSIVKITRDDVLRVAELAHLGLSGEEVETYQAQLDSILSYVDKLNELDVANIEPMAQVLHAAEPRSSSCDLAEHPELREDVLNRSNAAEGILPQAADSANPFFRVPKVIER